MRRGRVAVDVGVGRPVAEHQSEPFLDGQTGDDGLAVVTARERGRGGGGEHRAALVDGPSDLLFAAAVVVVSRHAGGGRVARAVRVRAKVALVRNA